MYNEPVRVTFVSYPTGPMAMVVHHEFDDNFYNWLDAEVNLHSATYVQHYDYYSMWENHQDSLYKEEYQAYLDARHDWQYSEQPSDPEDTFLFCDEEDDFEDEIPF